MMMRMDTPESQGITSDAVIDLVNEFERRDYQVTSLILLRNGIKIAGFCKPPYDIDSVQLWFSVTKSFTGIGVGIACDKGLLSLDDFVVSFFPDKLPAVISGNLSKMRVRHLLSMTSGIHENTYGLLYPQQDWVKAFLAQDFPHEPGTYYRYSTHGSHMLAAIVERVSKLGFYDFIKENLFEPLEIRESTWETDSQGITAGGMGLGLTVESVAKFAQMIVDKGLYNGKRIISADYLSAAMTEQADDREQEKGNHANGQGFHMRIDNDGSVFHPGAFGQLWYACPNKNIVAVFTSRRAKTYTDEVVGLIQEKIIRLAIDETLPASIGFEKMKSRLSELRYPVPTFSAVPENSVSLDGKAYVLDENPHGLARVEFIQRETERISALFQYANRPDSIINASFVEPVHGCDIFIKDIQFHEQKYVSYAVWENENTLVLTVFYIETPYEVTYRLTFDGLNITVTFQINVSFNLESFKCGGSLYETDEARRARIYPVILSECNPSWPEWYAEEKKNLEELIGSENIAGIHHIGSTAVPGLAAKPTVDILLEINKAADIDKLIAALPSPEYICLRGTGLTISTPPPHLRFIKGYLPDGFAERVYHIHIVYPGVHEELLFRDYLTTHPETSAEYADLKRKLFRDYEHDRDGYTNAKGAFVRMIIEKARHEKL